MPIPATQNYQIPGVYVTQSGSSFVTNNTSALNVTIIADNPTPGTQTDTFNNVVGVSGSTVGQLTVPMVNLTSTGAYASYSGFTVVWTSGTTTTTGTYGTHFNIYTPTSGALSYLTTSGISQSTVLPNGTVTVQYGHNWGAYGTYTSYNAVANAVGLPVSGSNIINPAVLAAKFAFNNGASVVQVLPVARVSSGTSASTSDWTRVFNISTSGNGNDPTFLSSQSNVDVFVPIYGFLSVTGTTTGQLLTYSGSTVATAIASYLNSQATVGNFQRTFLGYDGTNNQTTAAQVQTLSTGFGSQTQASRITLVAPGSLSFNPGFNTTTGLSNATFNLPGQYLAASLAGLFVGQPDVNVPITNKTVTGFTAIPNQISLSDALNLYLQYGITTVYQNRNGVISVLQGLTTNTTNWVTQEISVSAIGDRIANNVKTALVNSNLIGNPLTSISLSSAVSVVTNVLTTAQNSGLIQSYSNVQYSLNPSYPTTVFITFSYSPTYPMNYIQVTLSLNSQTGQIVPVSTTNTSSLA